MWFSGFFLLILSLIVEVYLWWKLQASLIFLSGRTCTIGGWLNTFLPHCIYIYYISLSQHRATGGSKNLPPSLPSLEADIAAEDHKAKGEHSRAMPPQTSYCAPHFLYHPLLAEHDTDKTAHIRKRLHAITDCTLPTWTPSPPHTHPHTQCVLQSHQISINE